MAEGESTKRQPLGERSSEGMVVRYVGTSNLRAITAADWKKVLGREHPEVSWHRDAPLNQVAVSRFDLDEVEFARFILADQDLRLVDLAAERAAG